MDALNFWSFKIGLKMSNVQPTPSRIIFRKVLKTEDDVLRFCVANKATILQCGQYLYIFEKSDFSESILRWYATNDNVVLAFNVFSILKMNTQQVNTLLADLEEEL